MKMIMLTMVAIAIFCTSSTILAEDKNVGFPSAIVDIPVYNFDPVVDGTEVSHVYVVKNKGTSTLEIDDVTTG